MRESWSREGAVRDCVCLPCDVNSVWIHRASVSFALYCSVHNPADVFTRAFLSFKQAGAIHPNVVCERWSWLAAWLFLVSTKDLVRLVARGSQVFAVLCSVLLLSSWITQCFGTTTATTKNLVKNQVMWHSIPKCNLRDMRPSWKLCEFVSCTRVPVWEAWRVWPPLSTHVDLQLRHSVGTVYSCPVVPVPDPGVR